MPAPDRVNPPLPEAVAPIFNPSFTMNVLSSFFSCTESATVAG
jgi:hypothetical protein